MSKITADVGKNTEKSVKNKEQQLTLRTISIFSIKNVHILYTSARRTASGESGWNVRFRACDRTAPEVLRNGAMSGALFETFVVSEIIKSYYNCGMEPPLWLFRDKTSEIDLLIEHDGKLHPVEIKKHADASRNDIRAFAKLDALPGHLRGEGCVVCPADRILSLSESDRIIPIGLI